MATTKAQRAWRERKKQGIAVPSCPDCGKRLRDESRDICNSCWLKTPEGRAYNQDKKARSIGNFDKVTEAKLIASEYSKELGFVNRAALEESNDRGELEVIPEIGFVHFHHRKDGQTTIYSLAVRREHLKQGWGRLLFYRVLCSAIERNTKSGKSPCIVAKCPEDLASNGFYENIGFQLVAIEPGRKRQLKKWEYQLKLPLLFVCNGGGTSQYDVVAKEAGWRLGIQSTNREGKARIPKVGWHMEMIDNEWGTGYRHSTHVELIKANKPLVATVRDLESVEQLPEVLKQAREIAPYCGRVIIIPKVKAWIPSRHWLGFSVPTSHGGTDIEPQWFSERHVHLLGGSPKDQADYAKQMNVVSLDGKYAMHDNVAGKGKSAWQGCNGGVRVVDGCYESFRVSLEKQKEYWHELKIQPWANDPLFSIDENL